MTRHSLPRQATGADKSERWLALWVAHASAMLRLSAPRKAMNEKPYKKKRIFFGKQIDE
jgi:hypothetical protein